MADHAKNLLQKKIYEAISKWAHDRNVVSFRNLVDHLSLERARQILNTPIKLRDTLYTPLMLAVKFNYVDLVKLLITQYEVDVEQEGTVQFDNYFVDGATALWCACSFEFFDIVQILVRIGNADVNHATETLSTPIRAACFNGNRKIVKFLVDNGADYTIANKYDNTCLMIASYNGNLDVVEYLLSLSVDCNLHAKCGSTAMHFASENGHLDVIKCLLSHGAKSLKNNAGKLSSLPKIKFLSWLTSHILITFL